LKAQHEAELAFEVAGTVTDVLAALGEPVEAGQALVVLDSALASLEAAKANADLAAAQEQQLLVWQEAERDVTQTAAENAALLAKKRQAVRDAKAELDQQRIVFGKVDAEEGDASTTAAALVTLRVRESAYRAAQQDLAQTLKVVEHANTLKNDAATQAKAAYLATTQASGSVAGLSSLEASQQLTRVKLGKTSLKAPFAGVVMQQDVTVGEYITPGTVVVTVGSVGDLELTADVPETDAAKLSAGAQAQVTFDAFSSSERFPAEVISIAPAAATIEGVPTFAVTLRFTVSNPRLKPGLTANITVRTGERHSVFAVPRRAVITRDGNEFVRVQAGEQEREVAVTTGLLGSDGRVEITSGLSGGENVVVSNGT
jgi:RND family efflux transporter MFP subunit